MYGERKLNENLAATLWTDSAWLGSYVTVSSGPESPCVGIETPRVQMSDCHFLLDLCFLHTQKTQAHAHTYFNDDTKGNLRPVTVGSACSLLLQASLF